MSYGCICGIDYLLLPFCFVGETYASNQDDRWDGSCNTLESADVSRVLSGVIPVNLAIGQRCLRASEAIDPVRSTVIRESLLSCKYI